MFKKQKLIVPIILIILITVILPFLGLAQQEKTDLKKDIEDFKRLIEENKRMIEEEQRIISEIQKENANLIEKIRDARKSIEEQKEAIKKEAIKDVKKAAGEVMQSISKNQSVVEEQYTEENPLIIPGAAVWMDLCPENSDQVCIFFHWKDGAIIKVVFFDRSYFGDRCDEMRFAMKVSMAKNLVTNKETGNVDSVDFKIYCYETEVADLKKPTSDENNFKNLTQEERNKWFNY